MNLGVNSIRAIDVSKCTELIELHLHDNQLSTLDVSNNTKLEQLSCNENQLSEIDVSNNTALKLLATGGNPLGAIDVSNNTELIELHCYRNQLSALDISNNTKLEWLNAFKNQFSAIDVSNNTALTYLSVDDNPISLGTIDVSNNTELTILGLSNCLLSELDLTHNTKLTNLAVCYNRLSELDLSNNTALKLLNCTDNRLRALDLSNHPALETLVIHDNQLLSLDLTNNPNIRQIGWWNDPTMSQKVDLGPISREEYDLLQKDPKIVGDKILNPVGATFSGTVMRDYKQGNSITYLYDVGSPDGSMMDVTLTFDLLYTVTFKDWDGTELKTEQTAYNTAATAPAAPTREGYRFTGWDKTFDVITGDTEITAQYIKTWTVTFKDEDGTVLKTEIVDEGTGATAPTEPAKEGHTFAGWNAAFDNVTEDTVVTATYTVNQYTVTFKDWDGSVLKTEQVTYNTGASAPTEPNREGYRFTGWDVSFENIMGDTIVTAQYEKEESIVPPTEPEQPQAPGQGGEMNNTEIKTQTGANLEAAKTGDDFIVEPLLVTGGISSIAAAIAFFFRKKKKLNHKEK